MDKWIKENKITTAIVVALIILLGFVFLKRTGKQTADDTKDVVLQARCADEAAKYFARKGYADGFDYKNHFNSKLSKCFILISSYDPNIGMVYVDLYDALEQKHYASYIGYNDCGTAAVKCRLNSGNVWLDGNDAKNPADYHVGFQGVAAGSGVGDENTQKQFMDHIQPFMND
jgi:hypothetical protein